MLINAINESFHTCFVIFSFPLWLISFWASCWSCLILFILLAHLLSAHLFSFYITSSVDSTPQSIFMFFWKNLHSYFSMHKFIYHLFVCLSLSRYRPLHQSLYISIPLHHSVLLSFLPVSFPPPTVSTYLTTFLFSYINLIKIFFFS